MSLRRRITISALAAFAASCASFGPPRPATLARIAPMAIAARPFERFEFEIESPALTGTFDGVIAAAPNGFALQLFPDVGGKVLELDVDLAAGEVSGTTPQGPLDPRFANVLAAMFAELRAPVAGARVSGERVVGERTEVALDAAFRAASVTAALDPNGAVASYTIALGYVSCVLQADGRFVGTRFRGRLQIASPSAPIRVGAFFHSPRASDRATIGTPW